MMTKANRIMMLLWCTTIMMICKNSNAFQCVIVSHKPGVFPNNPYHHTVLSQRSNDNDENESMSRNIASSSNKHDLNIPTSRRDWLVRSIGTTLAGTSMMTSLSSPSNAQVFFDPAQYGDQELRIGAVDSVKESVRRAILQNPQLAPAFYQLALLDGLSYNAETKKYGPDGRILLSVFTSKETDAYTKNLRDAATALIETENKLRKKVQISLADAIAIGGAESIESIGGPLLTVQLGRPDPPKDGTYSPIPIDLFSGKRSNDDIMATFKSSGLTEREATVLMAGLFTLDKVDKTRSLDDWKQSGKPKFREPGKIGRMSDFKQLTDEDIAQALLDAELEEELNIQENDGWYIADSFGSKDDRFGQRLAKEDINEKNFNKYIKELYTITTSKTKSSKAAATSSPVIVNDEFGWIGTFLVDPNYPVTTSWLQKYSTANLNFLKDLSLAYNSVTQLGAVYTGGKYESLLQKNKPRRSLNDDDLKLF